MSKAVATPELAVLQERFRHLRAVVWASQTALADKRIFATRREREALGLARGQKRNGFDTEVNGVLTHGARILDELDAVLRLMNEIDTEIPAFKGWPTRKWWRDNAPQPRNLPTYIDEDEALRQIPEAGAQTGDMVDWLDILKLGRNQTLPEKLVQMYARLDINSGNHEQVVEELAGRLRDNG